VVLQNKTQLYSIYSYILADYAIVLPPTPLAEAIVHVWTFNLGQKLNWLETIDIVKTLKREVKDKERFFL
jgi:hypothetical protein